MIYGTTTKKELINHKHNKKHIIYIEISEIYNRDIQFLYATQHVSRWSYVYIHSAPPPSKPEKSHPSNPTRLQVV